MFICGFPEENGFFALLPFLLRLWYNKPLVGVTVCLHFVIAVPKRGAMETLFLMRKTVVSMCVNQISTPPTSSWMA